MKPDSNWVDTRVCAEDLSKLLGVSVKTTEDFLVVLENLIIHRMIESLPDDCKGTDIAVELPYLGSLIVSVDDNDKVSTSFTVRNSLYRKIRAACHNKKSPLVEQTEDILGKYLVQKLEGGDIIDE